MMTSKSDQISAQPYPSRSVLEKVLDLWMEQKKEHDVPIQGKSMAPVLKEGDIARVVHDLSDLKPGDIVIYRKGWYLFAHRVLLQYDDEAGRKLYITQGDRSKRPDSPVEESEIIGRVVGVLRAGKYLTVDCQQQKWFRKLVDIILHIKIRIRRWMWILHLIRI
ncbi:MAG: signal peptidase I [Anaerolineales bacterium]|nr:signal peptidase I [Anaerolineales bacterium]